MFTVTLNYQLKSYSHNFKCQFKRYNQYGKCHFDFRLTTKQTQNYKTICHISPAILQKINFQNIYYMMQNSIKYIFQHDENFKLKLFHKWMRLKQVE